MTNQYSVLTCFESDVSILLSAKEGETFDRTLGGQESIGKTIAGFGVVLAFD